MGSSGSKAAQKVVRQYPTRVSGSAALPRQAPRARPSGVKDEAIRADATNPNMPDFAPPGFAERLQRMGVVQPNPTLSNSSTAFPHQDPSIGQVPGPAYPSAASNTTLSVLEARQRLQELADGEFANRGKSTDQGREFLDIITIRNILVLRQKGTPAAEIEARLRLKPGVVSRLGPPGVVEATAQQLT